MERKTLECPVVTISDTVVFESENRTKASDSNGRWFMALAIGPAAGGDGGGCGRKVLPQRRVRDIRRASARQVERIEICPFPGHKVGHVEGERPHLRRG